ncbi:MAG TPA: hypothetical protein PLI48_04270 [Gammaproteobacteria bacterium]|nr:hypothetical protein [Luteimonas sp.]HRP35080.1 hypothetical protein [Gammaproteobacteria bacterium]HRP73649.1 hypothetical protein [Luteimonas sp.]
MLTVSGIYIALISAGLLMVTFGYAGRSSTFGLGLMLAGVVTLLGSTVYYIWSVLA